MESNSKITVENQRIEEIFESDVQGGYLESCLKKLDAEENGSEPKEPRAADEIQGSEDIEQMIDEVTKKGQKWTKD